jgi:putative peptidoglycan lipid II flippase
VKTFSPAFFAREDTSTPMHAALLGLVIAIGGSVVLMPLFGHVGIAAATALSGWASAGWLGVQVARRFGFALDADAKRRLPRIVAAAVVMGGAVAVGRLALPQLTAPSASTLVGVVGLCLLIAAGVAVYLGCLQIMRVATPFALARTLRGKA